MQMKSLMAAAAAIVVGTGAAVTHAHAEYLETQYADPATGLTWAKFATLDAGAAQGMRAATAAEFSDLLSHAPNWTRREGTADEYHTNYPSWMSFTPFRGFILEGGDRVYENNGGNTGGSISSDWLTVSIGWLDGGTTGVVGAVSDRYLSSYGGAGAHGKAAVAHIDALAAGMHDSAPYAFLSGTDWQVGLAGHLQPAGQYQLAYYYMVREVPEPGTAGLMVLGVLSVVCARARRRG